MLGAAAILGLGMVQAAPAKIRAIAVENQYANVIAQIGGQYVQVNAIVSNPNTDPHVFEASPSVAMEVAKAQLIVRNGLGYDTWVKKILTADFKAQRQVIVVHDLFGLPENTPNPHLWYKPQTMPRVAAAIATALGKLDAAHRLSFNTNLKTFAASLKPWYAAIAAFKTKFGGAPVAVTEPVGDYLLQATGCVIKTPWTLQAAIMNGTDPAPQDVSIQKRLLRQHLVKVFVYNQQVTDPLTASFLHLAEKSHIPVVGVYETMPSGYSYQRWMMAEVKALRLAVMHGISTTVLK
ncbi:MAG: zinc ABC transporter solute-binding protein [Phycisphaerae bacterium]|nr:zinc ABC transporter solute-binding protein [Phycisphaerae bacterium]